MTVYVDDMFSVPMGEFKRGGRTYKMSHMIADDEAELHAFAGRIGVLRKWFQGDHYDVTMTRRAEAIRQGAVPITLRQLAFMAGNRRAGRPMGTPETAEAIARERLAARPAA